MIVRGRVYERRKQRKGGQIPGSGKGGALCATDPHHTATEVGKEFGVNQATEARAA